MLFRLGTKWVTAVCFTSIIACDKFCGICLWGWLDYVVVKIRLYPWKLEIGVSVNPSLLWSLKLQCTVSASKNEDSLMHLLYYFCSQRRGESKRLAFKWNKVLCRICVQYVAFNSKMTQDASLSLKTLEAAYCWHRKIFGNPGWPLD